MPSGLRPRSRTRRDDDHLRPGNGGTTPRQRRRSGARRARRLPPSLPARPATAGAVRLRAPRPARSASASTTSRSWRSISRNQDRRPRTGVRVLTPTPSRPPTPCRRRSGLRWGRRPRRRRGPAGPEAAAVAGVRARVAARAATCVKLPGARLRRPRRRHGAARLDGRARKGAIELATAAAFGRRTGSRPCACGRHLPHQAGAEAAQGRPPVPVTDLRLSARRGRGEVPATRSKGVVRMLSPG